MKVSCVVSPVPPLTATIQTNFAGTVYAGTEFGLSTDISFNDLSGVDVAVTVGISWSGGGGVISNGSRTAVTPVSGGGDSYTASLTYSPITTSDGGQFTANVTFRPTAESVYILGGSVQDTEMVMVNGELEASDNLPQHIRILAVCCSSSSLQTSLTQWWRYHQVLPLPQLEGTWC